MQPVGFGVPILSPSSLQPICKVVSLRSPRGICIELAACNYGKWPRTICLNKNLGNAVLMGSPRNKGPTTALIEIDRHAAICLVRVYGAGLAPVRRPPLVLAHYANQFR